MDFNYLARTQTQLAIKTLKQYKFKEKDLISKRNIDFKSIIGILNSDIAENKFNILYTLAEISF